MAVPRSVDNVVLKPLLSSQGTDRKIKGVNKANKNKMEVSDKMQEKR